MMSDMNQVNLGSLLKMTTEKPVKEHNLHKRVLLIGLMNTIIMEKPVQYALSLVQAPTHVNKVLEKLVSNNCTTIENVNKDLEYLLLEMKNK